MDMQIGQIMQVAKFNNMATQQWHNDYHKKINEPNGHIGLPQLAMYLFYDKRGADRKRGYVLKYKEGYLCRKTKRECEVEKQKRGL